MGYIYIALFWALKVLYIVRGGGGGSPHPPPVCSIHLDDATAAILCQNAPHTPATGGEETVMKTISVWVNWARPLLFLKDILGFLMTTESQDFGLTSHPKDGAFYSIVSPSLFWGVRTHTDHRVSTPRWSH